MDKTITKNNDGSLTVSEPVAFNIQGIQDQITEDTRRLTNLNEETKMITADIASNQAIIDKVKSLTPGQSGTITTAQAKG